MTKTGKQELPIEKFVREFEKLPLDRKRSVYLQMLVLREGHLTISQAFAKRDAVFPLD